ncbi:cell wall metabolism sensor histidine kinase WalK [Candidatus Kuenenbacteria bacterium]|nr:cell wall metabolism sensor histidine kinase WalK [Candidatus Kuenenbacteria bacterium]
MSIKLKTILYFSLILLAVIATSGYSIFISNKISQYLKGSLPASISDVQKSSHLVALAQLIRYDDEVLTQSARNHAFTGDQKWRVRYEEFVPKLDAAIKEALELGDTDDREIFASIDQANLALVAIEVQSIDYAAGGELTLAQAVLDSDEYSRQKNIYRAGLEKFLARRGTDFDSATEISVARLEESKFGLSQMVNQQLFLIVGFIVLFVFILLFLFYFIFKTFMAPLGVFKKTAGMIIRGDLDARVNIKNKDEIGDFAVDFNKMTASLAEALTSVNQKVAVQTKDLARKSADLGKQQKAILNILEDVQEEKQKAEGLAAIVKDAEEAIIGKKLDGTITSWNRGAENLYGYSAKEAIGRSVEIVVPRDKRAELDKILATIKAGGRLDHSQTVRQRKDGSLVDVSLSVSPIKNTSGQVIGASTIALDITKEKQIDRAKTEFVSLASHQLRTPLSAINWYAEMLLAGDAGKINAEQKQYLEEIYRGNQRMVDLVNTLLNVSRLELGTFVVEPQLVLITDLAAQVIKELKPLLTQKQVKLKTHYQSDLPKIMLDPKLTTIILQNLLSNAVKYNRDKGSVEFDISTTKDDYLEIKVKDTGLGIPQNQKNKIFDKLFRADNVRATDTEGTGLGLYIVKSIVEDTGGKIWFASTENKGTTFYVTLPLAGMRAKKGTKKLS